jgi:hypothetical protein
MKTSKAFLLTGFALVMIVLAALSFRAVPIPHSIDELHLVEGRLTYLDSSSKTLDLLIRIEGVDKRYYINRAFETPYGHDIISNKDSFMGQKVLLGYPHYWTPLDPNNSIKHVSYLELDGQVLFTEIKK